jgi:CubicO group peptidase (beta-lactamase class C family)
MARFGELFRNFGVWANQQIVPADWTITSTAAHCWSAWNMQYAYHWWLPNLPGFFAAIGAYGQEIFVSRETGLVIVFTADLPSDVANTNFESIIRDYVIPAIT